MSTEVGYESRRKHRHDLGHEDHGPVVAAKTTKGIQALMGIWVGLTFVVVLWSLIVGGSGSASHRDPGAAPAAATEPAH